MTLDLSQVKFEYDFFTLSLPDGSTLIMNSVDEDFISAGGIETVVKAVNLVVVPVDGSDNIPCSSVIGMGNDYFDLSTGYIEYLGKILNTDNMQYCILEIKDNG